MRRLLVVGLMLGLVVAGGPGAAAGPAALSGHQDSTRQVVIRFDSKVAVGDVVRVLRGVDFDVVEVVSEDAVGSETYTTGVIFRGRVSPVRYVDELSATFGDMAGEMEASEAADPMGGLSGVSAAVDEMAFLAGSVAVADRRIVQIMVEGRGSDLDRLVGLVPVGADAVTVGEVADVGSVASSGSCADPWWPYRGWISTQYSSDVPNRYVYQKFIWTQERLDNLAVCGSTRNAYEHEAWYYDYDGKTFLSGDTVTWSSSMPDVYLDWEALNPGGELGRTVGTGTTGQLTTGRYYTTYIRTRPGNAEQDTGKVQVEAVKNYCTGKTYAFCVFGHLDREKGLVPAWYHSVPGSQWWTHY